MRPSKALLLSIFVAACSRSTDLTKFRQIYSRWESGWQSARSCLLGSIARSPDPSMQLELASLLDSIPECPNWFIDTTAELPRPSPGAAVSLKLAEKETRANENAINIWTELGPEDLTDELAGEVLRLTTSIEHARRCQLTRCPFAERLAALDELLGARVAIRRALGALPEPTGVTLPTHVTVLAPAPPPADAPRTEPAAGTWSIVHDGTHYAILSETGTRIASILDEDGAPSIISDAQEPVVWTSRPGVPSNERHVTVYQPGRNSEKRSFEHVVRVEATSHRLDIFYHATADDARTGSALHWTWFSPGKHDPSTSILRNSEAFTATCSAENYLWIVSRAGTDEAISRIGRLAIRSEQTVRTMEGPMVDGQPVCSDAAIAYNGRQLCAIDRDCVELNLRRDSHTALIDDQMVVVDPMLDFSAKRGQLIAVRAGNDRPRVFRIPSGWQFADLVVRDAKPLVRLTGQPPQEVAVPWPWQ
jgi:hypothetical protein